MEEETVETQSQPTVEPEAPNPVQAPPAPVAVVKAKVTTTDALLAAMTPEEVLARPHDYAKWYNGMRVEALNG